MRRIFAFCCVLTAVCMSTEVSSLEGTWRTHIFWLKSNVSRFSEGSSCTNFDGTAGVCKVDRFVYTRDDLKLDESTNLIKSKINIDGSKFTLVCVKRGLFKIKN